MTRFYFHSAAYSGGGTAPATEQSSRTNTATFDAVTVNRSMNTTKGTNQVGLTRAPPNTSANTYYVTKFVSQPIYQTSVAANTWTYGFATSETSTSHNWPVSGNNVAVPINIYVWRPSNGTLVGTISDGTSAATVDEGGTGTRFHIATISGSAVNNCQDGDVIVVEIWFTTTSTVTTGTIGFYFDGTDDTYTDGATSVTQAASYLETPETLQLVALTRVTNSNTLIYNIRKQVLQSNSLLYNLQQRVTSANTLKYNLLSLVTATTIVRYNLLQQILASRIILYSLLEPVLHSNTLIYNVLEAALPGDVLTFYGGDTVTWYTANTEPGQSNWLDGQYTWYLKVTTGNSNISINNITLLRLDEATRSTIKASKSINPAVTLTTAQTYTGTIDWDDDTQNPADKTANDIFAFTVSFAGAANQSVVVSFESPDSTRIDTPLTGAKDILYRILHAVTLKYNLLVSVSKSNTLKYSLLQQIVAQITAKYNVLAQVIASRTLQYEVRQQVAKNVTIKYNLLRQIARSLILRYNVLIKVAPSAITLHYNIRKQVTHSQTILWNLIAEVYRISNSNTLKYNILQRIQPKQQTLNYNIRVAVTKPNTLKYSLLKQITRPRTLLYNLRQRITHSQTLPYNLRVQVKSSKTLKYNLRKLIMSPRTLKYNLRLLVTRQRTLRYNVVSLYTRVYHAITLLYNVVAARITAAPGVQTIDWRRIPQQITVITKFPKSKREEILKAEPNSVLTENLPALEELVSELDKDNKRLLAAGQEIQKMRQLERQRERHELEQKYISLDRQKRAEQLRQSQIALEQRQKQKAEELRQYQLMLAQIQEEKKRKQSLAQKAKGKLTELLKVLKILDIVDKLETIEKPAAKLLHFAAKQRRKIKTSGPADDTREFKKSLAVERSLAAQLRPIVKRIKQNKINTEQDRQQIAELTRSAVERVYDIGAKYVSEFFKRDYFTTDIDITHIKRLTQEFADRMNGRIDLYILSRPEDSDPVDTDFIVDTYASYVCPHTLSAAVNLKAKQIRGEKKVFGAAAPDFTSTDPYLEYSYTPREPHIAMTWVSARDDLVCTVCSTLDGTLFEIDEPDVPMPDSDTHVNCRCTLRLTELLE